MNRMALFGLLIAFAMAGCSKNVSDENARKVKPGMTLAEVQAILGSGRKGDSGQYEWATEKGKLKVGFTGDKVSTIEFHGAGREPTAEEKKKEQDRLDTMWAEQKKDSDRVNQDRDRINALNDVYALLFAAVGTGDNLPANEAAAAASPLANVNKGMDAIRSGRVVVRWGAPVTDAVWAYEKDAPTNGGYVVGEKYPLAETITAELLRPFANR